MMNRIDAISNQPQMAFRAKAANRKQIHEFIDKSSDLAMELINKDRPIVEKSEHAIRRAAEEFSFNNIMKQILKETFIDKPMKKIMNILFKM